MVQITIKTNIKKFNKTFDNAAKNIEKDVIHDGLDKEMQKHLIRIKKRLKTFINNEIRDVNIKGLSKTTSPRPIPKSSEEWLKFLGFDIAGVSFENIQNWATDQYYTANPDANVVVSRSITDRNGQKRRIVRFRQDIGEDVDFKAYNKKAVDFFNNALFVSLDDPANPKYMVNPGINLSRFVKVFCARTKSLGAKKVERLKRAGKQYAEWTLYQDKIEEIMESSFLNINAVLDHAKNGRYDEAIDLVRQFKVTNKFQNADDWIEKIEQVRDADTLEESSNLPPGINAQKNALQLINNLRIVKRINKKVVSYRLTSSYTPSTDITKETDFLSALEEQIQMLNLYNHDRWFNEIVMIAKKVARKS